MDIYDNVVPFIRSEEEKMATEPRKIMGSFDGSGVEMAPFSVSACCNRVPVIDGHTLSVWVDIDRPSMRLERHSLSMWHRFQGWPES